MFHCTKIYLRCQKNTECLTLPRSLTTWQQTKPSSFKLGFKPWVMSWSIPGGLRCYCGALSCPNSCLWCQWPLACTSCFAFTVIAQGFGFILRHIFSTRKINLQLSNELNFLSFHHWVRNLGSKRYSGDEHLLILKITAWLVKKP